MKRTANIITSSAMAFFVSIAGLSCTELQERANSVFKAARFDGETRRTERVAAYYLNLRQEPSSKAAVLAVPQKGDSLQIESERGAWLNVTTSQGKVGWVYSRYVTGYDTLPQGEKSKQQILSKNSADSTGRQDQLIQPDSAAQTQENTEKRAAESQKTAVAAPPIAENRSSVMRPFPAATPAATPQDNLDTEPLFEDDDVTGTGQPTRPIQLSENSDSDPLFEDENPQEKIERIEDPGGIYTLEVPENMAVEFKENIGCRMHIVQDNEKVFGAIVSCCANDVFHPTLEQFADAKLKGINKPNWKETLREKATVSGAPAIHGQGTYTLMIRDFKTEMLSDMYLIFAGQRGFEVEFFHPTMDLYPYQNIKKEILAGLKIHSLGKAAQLDEFDQVLRQTWTEMQAGKDQPDSNPARLIDDLRSTNVLVRLKAVKSLSKLGPKAKAAIPALTEMAQKDADEDVREVAAKALANIGVGAAAAPSERGEEIGLDRESLALATEVVAGLNESYYSLVATDLQYFQSEFIVTRNDAYLGKSQIRWERDRPRLEVSFSGSLEPKFKTWLSNTVEFGFRSTILSRLPVHADYPLNAIRTGGGYELDYSADPSVVVHKTTVTGDFRRLRDFQDYEDGLKIHTEFIVRHAEGKHFVKSLTRQALKPGVQELKNRLIFTYTHREQHNFLRRLVIEDISPSGKTFWKLELQDVTLKSKKAPSRN